MVRGSWVVSWLAGAVAARAAGPATAAPPPSYVYLNVSDGSGGLSAGADDATIDQSGLCAVEHYPAFAGTFADRVRLCARLEQALEPFNVILGDTRPLRAGFDYSMALIGPRPDECATVGEAGGAAELDCGDANPRSVALAFARDGRDWVWVAHELGHAWGLEHVDVACDVMGAGFSTKPCPSENWSFVDAEGEILDGTPGCGATTQNSYRRLTALLGAWPGGARPQPEFGPPLCAGAGGEAPDGGEADAVDAGRQTGDSDGGGQDGRADSGGMSEDSGDGASSDAAPDGGGTIGGSRGCDCHVGNSSTHTPAWPCAALTLLPLWRRRNRRRA